MTHENEYNSEKIFFDSIKKHVNIMFDVGTCDESIYTEFEGIVHYFEPYGPYVDKLKTQPNKNTQSFFNVFGLSDIKDTLKFYPNTYSLIKRPSSSDNFEIAFVDRGDSYMKQNNIQTIDFLKIDVECMETYVFRGFGERLKDVKIIQFEYGIGQSEVGDNLDIMLSYLEKHGFKNFYYMYHNRPGLTKITDRNDTWQWCNIVSYNSNYFDNEPWDNNI